MQQHFAHALQDVETLAEARDQVIHALEQIKADTHTQMGFVSGIISSDGDEYIQRNIARLEAYTQKIRASHAFPIFCATDIFTPAVFRRLEVMQMDRQEREAQFLDVWRAILSSGHVTHVFFTPRWDASAGARDEHETATKLGLTLVYIPVDRAIP